MERIRTAPVAPLDLERERARAEIRLALREQMQQASDLADVIQSGNSTTADQRLALAMCLRGMVRISRYLLH
jgi:hypothetical protein